MPTIVWFIVGILGLAVLVALVMAVVDRVKLKQSIQSLWSNQQSLEQFIRPYHLYDYYYTTYRNLYNQDELTDDKTWSDLNLSELFHQMNFNFTAIGEMRLYATLRQMKKISNSSLIKKFKDNTYFRETVSYRLAQLGKSIYPLYPDQVTYQPMNLYYMSSTYFPFIGLLLMLISFRVGLFIVIVSAVLNMVHVSHLKKTYEKDLNSIFYSSLVVKIAYQLHKVEGMPELNVDFNHFKASRYLSGILGRVNSNDFTGGLVILVKMVTMLDYHLYQLIQRSFKQHERELLDCYEYLAYIDNHYAVSLWQETLDTYTEPQPINDETIDFEGLVHPLIHEAVPNDLKITQHILLTGSNASGKSTLMKAIALNLLLAQTTNTATATKFYYQPGLIYTSMANQDDVLSGDSYFMAEIKSIHRLLNVDSKQYIYCFIDEIFKGTNTTERIAASEAVLNYINASPHYRAIAATHDVELAELMKKDYLNYHFNETIQGDDIDFDYKIKPGKADTRNVIELLRITKFPDRIYQRALQNTEELDANKH